MGLLLELFYKMTKQTLSELQTQCCIVGGGSAGIMLGFLLARAGVQVTVLEKHADFFRDFRGDTIHPSTLGLMYELGILDEFLKLPYQPVQRLKLIINGQIIYGPDLSSLPTQKKFIAFMPQWDFLNFIASQGAKYPCFDLRMGANADELIEENAEIKGVVADTPQGKIAIRANLVVAADGRHSTIRELAGMQITDTGAPIDVLWFRIDKPANEPSDLMGRVQNGQMMVTINRGSYYQVGLLIHKGGFDAIMQQSLEQFHQLIINIAPSFSEVVKSIDNWDKVKLLNVQIDHLEQWHRPGLLCIGDAAHAMSPMGGVGVNYAVQDAVATANLLAEKIRESRCIDADLALVQKRRAWPAKMMQRLQVTIQNRIFRGQTATRPISVSRPMQLFLNMFAPILRFAMARIIGLGFRREHIQTPEYKPKI
jgi:2-polyprenyl-6-methoxyphenol hydroxylase-like FAD-dependent oxidoreductase